MMTFSSSLHGIHGALVSIDADVSPGLPSFSIVGLTDAAVRETRVRVQAAIENSGLTFPMGRITVELGPVGAARERNGIGLDLPIALAIIGADLGLACALDDKLFLGELSLSGDIRPVRGAFAAAEAASHKGLSAVFVAMDNAQEAVHAHRMVYAARTLREIVDRLRGDLGNPVVRRDPTTDPFETHGDMRDIRGHAFAVRAMEIAAAGGHSLLLVGGPGAGKTMLARRMPGIMPAMDPETSHDVTRVHSAAGLNIGGGLVTRRPFRAPHHSTTAPGVVGGGAAMPRPGEISLAHGGVLFLDEITEFSRQTLEHITEPMQTGEVVLSRASGTLRFPARCSLVASMLPCPCGRRDAPEPRRCRCSLEDVARMRARIPSGLHAELSMMVHMENVALDGPRCEDSATIRARVTTARDRQMARQGHLNQHATLARLVSSGAMEPDAVALLHNRVEASHARVLRVARTIADLADSDTITAEHMREAIGFLNI